MFIRDNIEKLRDSIEEVCLETGIDPDGIKIIAVTKNVDLDKIKEAIECGIKDLGENRVQEFLTKYSAFNEVNWHLIGHLQRNKVKYVVGNVDLIQSVDSVKLANEINERAGLLNMVQNVLIEVKTSYEETKFGIDIVDFEDMLEDISNLSNITVKGIMTIAPKVENEDLARPYFKAAYDLFVKYKNVNQNNIKLEYLSMGMSGDYRAAIREGSNMVRIGTAIFGNRNQ